MKLDVGQKKMRKRSSIKRTLRENEWAKGDGGGDGGTKVDIEL